MEETPDALEQRLIALATQYLADPLLSFSTPTCSCIENGAPLPNRSFEQAPDEVWHVHFRVEMPVYGIHRPARVVVEVGERNGVLSVERHFFAAAQTPSRSLEKIEAWS